MSLGARKSGHAHLSSWAVPVTLLSVFVVAQYGDALRIPFVNEDYSFLDMTRGHTVWSLWREPGLYVGPWFRPLSQGIHYWLFQSVFNTRVEPWHVVNAILALAVLLSYLALVRHISNGGGASPLRVLRLSPAGAR